MFCDIWLNIDLQIRRGERHGKEKEQNAQIFIS